MRALYLGRFQIFHNGHLDIVKSIASEKDIDTVVLGIGSAQYSRHNPNTLIPTILNPFTWEERKRMLESSLEGELEKPYEIVTLEDYHICPMWADNVIRTAKPGVVYTNTQREVVLFEDRHIPTRRFQVKDKFHAQIIREMIANNNNWEKYVPKGTAKFVREQNIGQILKELYEAHLDELKHIYQLQDKMGIAKYNPEEVY